MTPDQRDSIIAWLYPDGVQRLSPWLRWSVAAVVGACTGFMLVHNYPWPFLLYVDAVLVGFGLAVLLHIAADQRRTAMSGGPVPLRRSRELEAGHDVAAARQLSIRGWKLFSVSLLLGLVGMGVLVLGFAST